VLGSRWLLLFENHYRVSWYFLGFVIVEEGEVAELDVFVATQGGKTVGFVPYPTDLLTHLGSELALCYRLEEVWIGISFDGVDSSATPPTPLGLGLGLTLRPILQLLLSTLISPRHGSPGIREVVGKLPPVTSSAAGIELRP